MFVRIATLSIVVAGLAGSASAGPLADKAAAYGEWTPTWHRLGHGAIAESYFTTTELTEVSSFGGQGDSTIWTGTYLGAVALRFMTTGEPAALAEVLSAVDTLHHHLKVTGKSGFIARYRAPDTPPFNSGFGEHWYHGEGAYAGDVFITNTSRDQYTGWFFGMALAYDALEGVREDVRQTIREDVAEVVDALMAQNWLIRDLDGRPTTKAPNVLLPQQAAWAIIAAHVTNAPRFSDEYLRLADPSLRQQHRASSIAFLNKYVQHYGNNLAHTNFFNLMRLARLHGRDDDFAFWKEVFEEQVHRQWHLVPNAWFETVHWSVMNVPQPAARAQIVEDLTGFRNAPNLHISPDLPDDVELDPFSVLLVDLQEQYPFLKDLIGTARLQAKDAFPVPLQCPTDFLWQRNPYAISCGGTNLRHVDPGVDYLVAYWMARYHGVIDATD